MIGYHFYDLLKCMVKHHSNIVHILETVSTFTLYIYIANCYHGK